MIICNFKLNKTSILKHLIILMLLVAISISILAVYKMIKSSKDKEYFLTENSCTQDTDIAVIKSSNYSNILKQVHEDIDTYIGQKISFSGYIFKVDNFNDNQFVLARNMDIGNNQTLIVGFLCEYDDIISYDEYSWIEITGEITKGYYNNSAIPILKIIEIKSIEEPDNPTVPAPDGDYVPTSVIY